MLLCTVYGCPVTFHGASSTQNPCAGAWASSNLPQTPARLRRAPRRWPPPVHKSCCGASPPLLKHDLHAIDATPARCRGVVVYIPLVPASTVARRAPDSLFDLRTGLHVQHALIHRGIRVQLRRRGPGAPQGRGAHHARLSWFRAAWKLNFFELGAPFTPSSRRSHWNDDASMAKARHVISTQVPR